MMVLPRSLRAMVPRPFLGRRFLAVVLIVACGWGAGEEARAADAAGKVEDLRGSAFADAAQQHRALDRASPIYVGDRVSTGAASRLTMLLGTDTTIRLGENTQLVIDKFLADTGGEISLEAGPMLFDRPAGARRMPVQIRTPYAVLAVRGTQFFAGPSNGVFGVFVKSGMLEVSAAGTTVTLSPGQGTNVQSQGGAPTRPVSWGQSRIDEAYASVR